MAAKTSKKLATSKSGGARSMSSKGKGKARLHGPADDSASSEEEYQDIADAADSLSSDVDLDEGSEELEEDDGPDAEDSDDGGGRVVQYVGESDMEEDAEDEEEVEDVAVAGPSAPVMSLGEQLKAQKKQRRQQAKNGISASRPDDAPAAAIRAPGRRGRVAPRHSDVSLPSRPDKPEPKIRKPIPHRSDKHAPTEISSKKAVSRFRPIVTESKSLARDPRFDSSSGSLNPDLFSRSYNFLSSQRQEELSELKEAYRKVKGRNDVAREEKERMESAVRRLENVEVERRRKEREGMAMKDWKAKERQERKDGKGAFYLKKKDAKKIVLEDRFKDLSTDKRRLQKSLQRKRKKESAKDKKSMPRRAGV